MVGEGLCTGTGGLKGYSSGLCQDLGGWEATVSSGLSELYGWPASCPRVGAALPNICSALMLSCALLCCVVLCTVSWFKLP